MSRTNILVAIDFGTTLTGVAYSDPHDRRADTEPQLFKHWNGYEVDKIPTVLRYEHTARVGDLPRATGFRWGNQVRDIESCIKWFKLLLDPRYFTAPSSAAVDMSQTYPDRDDDADLLDVTAQRLTTDFLQAVREHVEDHLTVTYRSEAGHAPRFKWMMTVPAIWSNDAKNLTRECARAAGMAQTSDLLMTSEPEAAFIYAARRLNPMHKRIDNNVIILDAGGGTVDLVTYRIRQVQPTLRVEENMIPGGGKCGSVFINRVFEQMIDDKLENHDPPLQLSEAGRRTMMHHFETLVKRQFNGGDIEEFVPVTGLPANSRTLGIEGGFMRITRQEMVRVLDEVVDKVLDLVREQVEGIRDARNNVSAIILVGGFGASPYLKRRLEDDEHLRGIEVLRSHYPETAVVRGAVIEGLQELPHARTILSRRSVSSLGITSSVPFRADVHPQDHRYEDPVNREFLCRDVLSYFVRKNEDLREDVPVTFPFDRLVAIDGPFYFTDVVYETYEDDPPRILNGDTFRAIGSIDSDLSEIPTYRFERPGNGDYFRIRYTIQAMFSAVDVKLQLDFNGESYGSATLRHGNSAMFRPVRRDGRE